MYDKHSIQPQVVPLLEAVRKEIPNIKFVSSDYGFTVQVINPDNNKFAYLARAYRFYFGDRPTDKLKHRIKCLIGLQKENFILTLDDIPALVKKLKPYAKEDKTSSVG